MSEHIHEPAEFEVSPEGVVAAIEAEIQECGSADRYLKSLQLESVYDAVLDYLADVATIIEAASDDKIYVRNGSVGDSFYRGAMLGADIACRVLSDSNMPFLAEELDAVLKSIAEESICQDDEDIKDAVLETQELLLEDMIPYVDFLKQYEQELFVDPNCFNYGYSGMAMVLLAMARVMSKIKDEQFQEQINREVAAFAASLDAELDKLIYGSGSAE